MSYGRIRYRGSFTLYASALAVVCAIASAGFAQTGPSRMKGTTAPDAALSEELNKYPGLLPELGQLFEKLKGNVQFPEERRQSDILPLLPSSTTFYAAFPNYGEAAHQALMTFRDELKQSAVLRTWWQQIGAAKTGPQIESSIEKFHALSQYLGDEMVLAGEGEGAMPRVVFVTEVRKPGLKDFLRQMLKDLPDKSNSSVRVLDPQELAVAKTEAKAKSGGLVVLVRPDFAIAGSDLAAVRSVNDRLEAEARTKNGGLALTPFGQRLLRVYEEGTSVVAAADLHKIISSLPPAKPDSQKMLERSGFKDVKYLVWDRKGIAGRDSARKSLSEMELSFIGPRRGAAAWLRAPEPLGSLEFVSPKSAFIASIALKNPGEVFDDIKAFASESNPSAFAALPAMEQAMHVNLRDDLLSQLQGEITFALTDFTAPKPEWKAILRLEDSDRLEKALAKLLLSAPVVARQTEEGGVTYHSLMVPSSPKPLQIEYALVDRYLIVASSHNSAVEAVRAHRTGESIAKAAKFLESFPPGHPPEVSALIYEDASAIRAFRVRQLPPEMAEALSQLNPSSAAAPIVYCVYGDERAIRAVSTGGGAEASAVLLGAAIAMPHLPRAKTAADESAAVGALRAINVAQTTYSHKYLQNGYARDLASLGPDPRASGLKTANHAGLIEPDLGSSSCTAGAWCEKAGYRFSVEGVCTLRSCREFVVVATPVSRGPGSRNFCSTSDAVIRFNAGPALISPVSAEACRQWTPLN